MRQNRVGISFIASSVDKSPNLSLYFRFNYMMDFIGYKKNIAQDQLWDKTYRLPKKPKISLGKSL